MKAGNGERGMGNVWMAVTRPSLTVSNNCCATSKRLRDPHVPRSPLPVPRT